MTINISPKGWTLIAFLALTILFLLFSYVLLPGPQHIDNFFNEPFGGESHDLDAIPV